MTAARDRLHPTISKTRNQFGSNATWVRIPPSAPKAAPCGALLFIFAANYARVARWDSPTTADIPAAVRAAENSDAVILVVGGSSARDFRTQRF